MTTDTFLLLQHMERSYSPNFAPVFLRFISLKCRKFDWVFVCFKQEEVVGLEQRCSCLNPDVKLVCFVCFVSFFIELQLTSSSHHRVIHNRECFSFSYIKATECRSSWRKVQKSHHNANRRTRTNTDSRLIRDSACFCEITSCVYVDVISHISLSLFACESLYQCNNVLWLLLLLLLTLWFL